MTSATRPLLQTRLLKAGYLGREVVRAVNLTQMSARDNLRVGGGSVETALELFPELEPRLDVRGGMLSGGEQQMLALARALSRDPKLLLGTPRRRGSSPDRRDRRDLSERHVRDRGRSPRAVASQEQAQGMATPTGSRA